MEYKYKRECGPVVEKLTREGEVAGSGHFGFRVKKYWHMPGPWHDMVGVAEPPELSRLMCVGRHHKGNTSSNALQTEQFLVCRVTSR